MATVPFEQLEVYQLAERLSDEVWLVVLAWASFRRTRLANSWCEPWTVSGRTSRKKPVGRDIRTTAGSFGSPAALSMRPDIGYGVRISEGCWKTRRSLS
jgi:hypothetical protein